MGFLVNHLRVHPVDLGELSHVPQYFSQPRFKNHAHIADKGTAKGRHLRKDLSLLVRCYEPGHELSVMDNSDW